MPLRKKRVLGLGVCLCRDPLPSAGGPKPGILGLVLPIGNGLLHIMKTHPALKMSPEATAGRLVWVGMGQSVGPEGGAVGEHTSLGRLWDV